MDTRIAKARPVATVYERKILDAGAVGLAALFRRGALSPPAVLDVYSNRIVRGDGAIGAFTDLDLECARDAARASAERWTAGRALSPLDGVPIAIKSNIAVRHLPWTAGIGAYGKRIAAQDAACVAALRAAGALILGTTNMDEGALGAATDNPWFGRTHNPVRHGFTAGGSSGGSAAAVRAGFCAAALGTDTIGSVRIPASYCGVFGHKPARGFIASDGVEALSWTFDTVGVLARSAADCAALAAAAAGARPAKIGRMPQNAKLAALAWDDSTPVAPAIADAFGRMVDDARAAGWPIRSVRLESDDGISIRKQLLFVAEAEAACVHEDALAKDPDGFSGRFRKMVAWGASQSAARLAGALHELDRIMKSVREELSEFDGIVSPATPHTAFAFDGAVPSDQARFSALPSLLGWPATAFPIGTAPDGLPLAAQIMAKSDPDCLAFARAASRSL